MSKTVHDCGGVKLPKMPSNIKVTKSPKKKVTKKGK